MTSAATRLSQARKLLAHAPLVDGHNDLAWEIRERFGADLTVAELAVGMPRLHTDLSRLRRGHLGAQFWSVYVPGTLPGDAAVATTLEQIDLVRRVVAAYADDLELAGSAADVERIFASRKIASLLGAEGGHSIAGSMGVLRMLFQLGVRYMTLTHNFNVPWADAATDEPAVGGLTAFGQEVIHEMQRLGMLVDLSHVAADTARQALDVAEGPIIFSHSCARALCDHLRNVPDDVLSRLTGNGGVCMVAFVPAFVSPECREWDLALAADMESRGLDWKDLAVRAVMRTERTSHHPRPRATLGQVADHVEHVRAVAGIDHVGIGADYDGTDQLPVGLEDVSCYPALFAELLGRGWSESDCALLAGGNVLRVMREAETAAGKLRKQRGPSLARCADALSGAKPTSGCLPSCARRPVADDPDV